MDSTATSSQSKIGILSKGAFKGRADRGIQRGDLMPSLVKKRSIVLRNHKTSFSLEDEFWEGLREIARLRRTTPSDLVNAIEDGRGQANLSSAIRLFVLDHYRSRLLIPGN